MQVQNSPRDIQTQSQTSGIVMLLQLERAKDIQQIICLDSHPESAISILTHALAERILTPITPSAGVYLTALNSKFQL